MKRLGVVILAALSALLLVPSATPGSEAKAPEIRYLRLTATRYIRERADFLQDKQGAWDGVYHRQAFWQVRAIVVFNGFGVSIIKNGAVVTGGVQVTDERRDASNGGAACAEAERAGFFQTDYESARGPHFVAAPRADAGISGSGRAARFFVSPRDHVPWTLGCTTNETLGDHGVSDDETFDLPAFAKAKFRGRAAFGGYCADDYDHADKFHSFQGVSKFNVSLVPFPPNQLKNMRKALRNSIGQIKLVLIGLSFPGSTVSAESPDPNAPDCS